MSIGCGISSGVHAGYAALVDLRKGNVAWISADNEMGGNMRSADGPQHRVTQLLEDFPGGHVSAVAGRATVSRLGAALIALAAASISVTASAEPKPDFTVPPYSAAYKPQGADVRDIWMQADESERELRDACLVIADPALNTSVRGVLCRTVGADRRSSARDYVLRIPEFNAMTTPNGAMLDFSGLMLRVRNEAELASILGHEFAHFELRHSLLRFRQPRSDSDIFAWTSLLKAISATYGMGTTTSMNGLQVAIYGAFMRYSRDQERAADILGFGYMANARYRPSAAAEVCVL